jgi:hypothetical protein
MSRAQLTSTTQQDSGGAVAPFLAGKNKIINGDFGIWQRGTSFSNPASAFLADKWITEYDGSGSTKAINQRTFTPGAAPAAGYEGTYYCEYACSVAGSGGTYNLFEQRIEDVRTFAGQTVTFSFWAKASSATTIPSVGIRQNFGSGGSGTTDTTITTNLAVTTSWQRFTGTVTVPSVSGATIGSSSYLRFAVFCPVNATYTLSFWGFQFEAGSVATPFTTASNTLQGELAACQRYYWQATGVSGLYSELGLGYAASTTTVRMPIKLPQTMRIAPTTIGYSGVFAYDGTTYLTPSAITSFFSGSTDFGNAGITVTGATANRPYSLVINNVTTAYLSFSAEL